MKTHCSFSDRKKNAENVIVRVLIIWAWKGEAGTTPGAPVYSWLHGPWMDSCSEELIEGEIIEAVGAPRDECTGADRD